MSSDQHSEMGLSFPTPFRKPPHDLPTPPNSPQEVQKELKRQVSRFRLPKILKRNQPVNLTASEATETNAGSGSSSSRALKCSNKIDPGLPTPRTLDPMEQPLPLVAPVASTSTAKDESLSRHTSRKLRKMPASYRDLRAYKSDNQINSQPTKPVIKVPALLPSPLPSDTEDGQSRRAHFAFQNPREHGSSGVEADEANATETSYEYENIVAGYCEDVFDENRTGSESAPAMIVDNEWSLPDPLQQRESTDTPAASRTPPTSNMSATLRSPKMDRSSSLSSEATWLSKSFARPDHSTCIGQLERIQMNEKRPAEKSRRCCHVVQGPNDDLSASWTGERKASYATVIKPGKANDIWVPRSSSYSSKCSKRSGPSEVPNLPRTPEGKLSEVSAFSPWDSPADRRGSVRLDRDQQSPLRKVATYGNLRHSLEDYTPTRKPLFPPRKSSLCPTLNPSPISISPSPSSSASTLTSESSRPESPPSSPLGTHPTPPFEDTRESLAWRTHVSLTRTLDSLSHSINNYPASPSLQLNSPSILQLRSPHSLDELHLKLLHQIFPNTTASRHHLSTLAAILIAQSYLANSPPPPVSVLVTEYAAPRRSKYSRHHLVASSNASRSHVPLKALNTLGIRFTDVTMAPLQEQAEALRQRTNAVAAALHVLAQKVMLLVAGRWDEVVWRCLLALVEVVEAGGEGCGW